MQAMPQERKEGLIGSMTFDEFKILVKGMKAVYTSERFLPDADSIKIWYSLLKDLQYTVLNAAIQKYISLNKFPPTIADLREIATTICAGDLPDWGEGWEKVLQAIRRFGFYRESEALQTMDELTQTCVKRLGWRNLCLSENNNHDRANFRMIYEQLAERTKKEAVLPISLNNTIKQLNASTVKQIDCQSAEGGRRDGEC